MIRWTMTSTFIPIPTKFDLTTTIFYEIFLPYILKSYDSRQELSSEILCLYKLIGSVPQYSKSNETKNLQYYAASLQSTTYPQQQAMLLQYHLHYTTDYWQEVFLQVTNYFKTMQNSCWYKTTTTATILGPMDIGPYCNVSYLSYKSPMNYEIPGFLHILYTKGNDRNEGFLLISLTVLILHIKGQKNWTIIAFLWLSSYGYAHYQDVYTYYYHY